MMIGLRLVELSCLTSFYPQMLCLHSICCDRVCLSVCQKTVFCKSG